jgi:hypothetical protein
MATQLQRRIVEAVGDGRDLDEIEATIIDPAPLDEDERAALWLLAQALRERGPLVSREPVLVGL